MKALLACNGFFIMIEKKKKLDLLDLHVIGGFGDVHSMCFFLFF